ncbi:MAG: Do family serine endopeptidase [Beijerinckiaceae bacterium]
MNDAQRPNPQATIPPGSASSMHLLRSRKSVRAAMLGAVAVVALGGALGNSFVLPHPAQAEAPLTVNVGQANGPASFADIVDRVKSSVVAVKVKMVETADASDDGPPNFPQVQPGDPLEKFFKRFGGEGLPFQFRNQRRGGSQAQALGSGFIISADGYVVTNNHVVEHASDVSVTLDDGRSLSAKVVGTDKKTDLALLKITEGGNFPHVDFGSKEPRIGDWVIAVGNPFGLGGTVTAGIVSARGRDIGAGPYDDFLQIDAPVNRGNSGGPTFDTQGQVVGVNTAIYSPSGGSVGIGFAIPAEVAKDVVASLKDKGTVSRGWIGVQIQPINPEIADSLGLKGTKGALVAETQAGSPAAAAGIKSGDVIVGVNGDRVDGPRELARRIAALGPEKKVDLTYVRDGTEKTASVRLGTLPVDKEASVAEPGSSGAKTSLANLGVALAPASSVNGAKEGVVITDVDPDGVAAQKGLRSGDIILEAAGHPVSRPSEISSALDTAKKEGRKAVLLRIKTGDQTRFVALAANPA